MARIRRNRAEKDAAAVLRVWKVGKYIRLSRDDGNCESESITNQRKILDEQLPGYFSDDYEIVDEYIDDGRTGTSDDTRPEFLRLAEDVRRGRINCIVTKNLSRAFRNSANQGKFLEEFIPLYNTRFISLYEPRIDTFLNPEVVHSLEVSITGFMNEQYAYKTSVDVRRTFDTKRKKGEFIGAFAPYGLMKRPDDKNRLMIDEQAAEVVRDIFHWFVNEGMSKNGITRRLNELGIPNPAVYKRQKGLRFCNPQLERNDGLWNEKTVRDILLNQMYIGNMVQGRQKVISYKVHDRVRTDEKDWYIVENTHEAIIDRATFDKAQSLHQRDTRVPPNRKKVYLFSGFVRCADCKKAMTRKVAKNNVYYCCATYSRQSKTACTKHTVREEVLEKTVLIAIQKQIALVADLTEIIEEIQNAPVMHAASKRIDRLLASKQKELEKLTVVTDNLYMDWRTGEIDKAEYRRIKEKMETQFAQVQQVIANLQKEKEVLTKGTRENAPYLATFLTYQNIAHLERGILVELVRAIDVHKNGQITIEFAFADQHRRVLEHIEYDRQELKTLDSKVVHISEQLPVQPARPARRVRQEPPG